ncbi:hypothetical protein M5689_009363 [Euphorbia peplus]|nr:hypothetical protein M5689_009363 [Euphorbia peplus]
MCMIVGVMVVMMMMIGVSEAQQQDRNSCLRQCDQDCNSHLIPLFCKGLCLGQCPSEFPGTGFGMAYPKR